MTTWVYNNNSSRRGVWHIPDGELEYETVAERSWGADREQYIFAKHKHSCEFHVYGATVSTITGYGQGDYWSRRPIYTSRPSVCSCGVGDIVHTGKYRETCVVPEHKKLKKTEVLCNQVTIHSHRGYKFNDEPIPEDGGVYVTVATIDEDEGIYTFEGSKPPGPVCSRCLKKIANDS